MTSVCEKHTHICIQTAVYANYNYTVIDQSTRINDAQIENAVTVFNTYRIRFINLNLEISMS